MPYDKTPARQVGLEILANWLNGCPQAARYTPCMCMYIYIYIYMYVCMYVCMNIYIYIYVCVYIYIYIHTIGCMYIFHF